VAEVIDVLLKSVALIRKILLMRQKALGTALQPEDIARALEESARSGHCACCGRRVPLQTCERLEGAGLCRRCCVQFAEGHSCEWWGLCGGP